jgi:tryptophan 2-C-methyltransferase
MGRGLVVLVNPSLVHPGLVPYALDVLSTSLEREQFDVDVVDLTFQRERWRDAVRGYFTGRAPLLIGVTIREVDSADPQRQGTYLPQHREVIREIRSVSRAPIVLGGAGFSLMPHALVDYLAVDYGVRGPGETLICQLASELAAGRSPRGMPGLIVNHGGGLVHRVPTDAEVMPLACLPEGQEPVEPLAAYRRRSRRPKAVDNAVYYERGGQGTVLVRTAGLYSAAHDECPGATSERLTRSMVVAVVDELEALADQGVCDVCTLDEPGLRLEHRKAFLREVIARKGASHESPLQLLRLWTRLTSTSFDEELVDLLAAAGYRGISVAPDQLRDGMVNGWMVTGRGTRFDTSGDVRTLCRLARRHGLLTMVEATLGLPGETIRTLYECVDAALALDATVVRLTLGIRLYPYSPLGIWAARQCGGVRALRGLQSNAARERIVLKPLQLCASVTEYERQFTFDESDRPRPVYYFSPALPEGSARVVDPRHRWQRTIGLIRAYVPAADYARVILPTVPDTEASRDGEVVDDPFLTCLVALGYKGPYWSHWPRREEIFAEGAAKGAIPATDRSGAPEHPLLIEAQSVIAATSADRAGSGAFVGG